MDKEKEEIVNTFTSTTKEVLDILNDLEEEQLSYPDTGDLWSPAEIIEHLYRSEIGYMKLFSGPSKPTENRKPTDKIAQFKSAFYNNNNRYKAPEPTRPNGDLSVSELFGKYQSNRDQISRYIHDNNSKLDQLLQAFTHPSFGHLTGIEWIAFSNIHTKRHLEQLKRRVNIAD